MESQNNKNIGTILGKKITQRDFYMAKAAANRAVELDIAESLGTLAYNREMVRRYIQAQDLDALAWKRLIALYAGRKLGVAVSSQALVAMLDSMKVFRTEDGSFDYDAYRNYLLSVFHIEPVIFEEELKDNLTVKIVSDMIGDLNFVSKAEIDELYRQRYENIDLYCVFASAKDMDIAASKLSNDAVEDFFTANKGAYTVPVRRRVEYVVFGFDSYDASVVDDAMVEDFYNTNTDAFVLEDGTRQDFEQVSGIIREKLQKDVRLSACKEDARKVYYATVQGKNFEQAASDEGMKVVKSGLFGADGELDGFTASDSAKIVREAFGLELHSVSAPMVTDGAVVLVMPVEEQQAHIPAFDDVKSQVKKDYKAKLQMDMAKEKVEQFRAKAEGLNAEEFAAKAVKHGLEVLEMEAFSMLTVPTSNGIAPEDAAGFFALKEQALTNVFRINDGYAVSFVNGFSMEEKPEDDKDIVKQANFRKKMMTADSVLNDIARNPAFPA